MSFFCFVLFLIISISIEVFPSFLDIIIGFISLTGAVYLIFLAIEGIRFKGTTLDVTKVKPQSIRKGIIINLLNPNPYIFWFTIGAPTVISGAELSFMAPVAFVTGMYLFLVGSKIMLAILVGQSKIFLKSRLYIYTIRILGIILLVFAAWQLRHSKEYRKRG